MPNATFLEQLLLLLEGVHPGVGVPTYVGNHAEYVSRHACKVNVTGTIFLHNEDDKLLAFMRPPGKIVCLPIATGLVLSSDTAPHHVGSGVPLAPTNP